MKEKILMITTILILLIVELSGCTFHSCPDLTDQTIDLLHNCNTGATIHL